MPIEVITGLPGHGKTLLLMEKLHDANQANKKAIEKGKPEEVRALFACGISGLKPGLATVLDNPADWNAEDPNGEPTCDCRDDGQLHAHVVPDGSLIFVDEAWKWYGHLHNARGQPNPPHVLQFAEHRHRGLDFVMTTQGPGQLYPFLRTLIEGHTHVVRTMGLEVAQLYKWPELNDDPKSKTMRDAAIKQVWRYPKARTEEYNSATKHTIKRKIPARILLIPVLVIAGLSLAYFGFKSLTPEAMAAPGEEGRASSLLDAGPATRANTERTPEPERMTAEEWALRFAPRIPEYPASAPAWDGRAVVSNPRLVCMIGETVGCICKTEQGTNYEMDQLKCVAYVNAGGAYDPFKAEQTESWQGSGEVSEPSHDEGIADASPGA